MELVYASLILHRLGKEINESNLKKIMEAAGTSVDDAKIKAIVAALEGVDIESALKEAAVAAPAVAEQKPAPKKEEKKEEKKDEAAAAAGLGALFG